jgi:ankyrin repeat protein
MELNGAAYFGIGTGKDETQSCFHTSSHELGNTGTESLGLNWEQELNAFRGNSFPFNSSTMEVDQIPAPFQDGAVDLFQERKVSSTSIKIPFQNLIHTSSNASTRNRLRSLFRPKSSGSSRGKKKYPASQFTAETEDSGYASGFGSCLTIDQVRQIHSQSLREFNGLYRVACHILHEPRGKAQCKDIASCTYCQYSSIHNLGWSARYLKLEVFLSELRLDEVYDLSALDAAGNTALHYAAAGGAGFKHLKALIDAGVDPYAANTAGELFIYCLRPLQPFTLEPNSDCLKGDDLMNLLELLQPEQLCDWRDNNGQTILHTLALKITEPELKGRIFRYFLDLISFSSC